MKTIEAPDLLQRIVVINDATSARGGATGLARLSIRMFAERGFEVTYIVGDDGISAELEEQGVDVVTVGGKQLIKENPLKAFARGVFNSRAREVLATWIARNDTPNTVYHVHGWSKILSPSIFQALRPVAHRTVTHAHDFFLACPNGAFMDYQAGEVCDRVALSLSCLGTNCDKRSYAQKLWRSARTASLNRAKGASGLWAKLLMIHEGMAPRFVSAGYDNCDLLAVRNPAAAFSDTRIHAERNSTFYYIGRVEAEKGVEDAIKAATLAGVRLTIIGDGPLRSKIEAEYPDVVVCGWRTPVEIAALLADARCVLMPSRYPEPYGLVAAEASQSGLPVIVSKTALLSREISENGVGLSCDTRNIGEFAAAIRSIADMADDDMAAMSARAFARSAKLSLTATEWVDRLLSIYRDVLASR